MKINNLQQVLADQPKFRFKQAWQDVFVSLITNWNESTTLPQNLKERLNKECPLDIKAEVFGSDDRQTIKALITLKDNNKIETVLLKHRDDRITVCVSSQVGCPLGCSFCATGKMGYVRNLELDEIIEQVIFWQRFLNEESKAKVTNLVYMGMGEPFLNYATVMQSIKLINDENGLNIGARHISVSTSGIIEGIDKFIKEDLQVNLAISLHAANDKLRTELMPINKKYSLGELMKVVEVYVNTKGRRVMFEYLMIDGVNDGEEDAKELIKIINHPLYIVNLIKYNATGDYKPSSPQRIEKFKHLLMRAGIRVTQRYAFGGDIFAACGQLAGKKQ